MEYETDDTNQTWFNRLKESPRTVSALIIILIVAAAIYAFSGNQNKDETQVTPSPTPTEEAATATPTLTTKGAATTPVTKEEIVAAAKALPEATKTDSAYVEVAERGDSLTVLARRATSRYLAENNVEYQVTNEHRIYIEDYIKDHLARKPVRVGSEQSISFDLIKAAVASANTLSEKQLNHLTQYTHVLK